MGLSFMSQKDRQGAALIVIYDGRELERRRWEREKSIIEDRGFEVYLLAIDDEDGEEVRDFYDLDPNQTPLVLIVRDNDEVVANWSGESIPATDQIIFTLNQTS